jgi:hypothetical protein
MAKCTSEVCIPAVHVKGDSDRDRMVVGFTTTYMQSVPITTDVVIWNLNQGEVYSIM